MSTVRTSGNYRPTKGVLYLRGIPSAVKTLFKSVCVRRGDNMTDVIAALMHLYVEKPDVVRVPKRRK